MSETSQTRGVVVAHAPPMGLSRQGLPSFVGISGKTAGARAISMYVAVVPPGGPSRTCIAASRRRSTRSRHGRDALRSALARIRGLHGRGVFIAPDVPHQAINLSQTEPAIAVVARNDPSEQESVVLYDPSSEPDQGL